MDPFPYSDRERDLIEGTFQSPNWYYEAGAHYPLVIATIEALNANTLDAAYNDVGRHYDARQGISTRSHCPIFLGTKTHVLAIQAALNQRVESDFYVSDLRDVFRAVLERSVFKPLVWESPLANREHPTPYAYLLYEIAGDLRHLSETALEKSTTRTASPQAAAPGRIASDLAMTWSFCVWSIARSSNHVSSDFRDRIIEQYFLFVLALGWQPSEVYHGPIGAVAGLEAWRDLFMDELERRFAGAYQHELDALRSAFDSLDRGKRFVFDGADWLQERLFGNS
ncbi:MAG TPA: hypothetical protein VFU50_16560 [Terriglobales bacterium]|nr:hypothetical protein [Terriglobales bacterium]